VAGTPTPFFRGKDVTLIFLRDSQRVEFKCKTIDVKRNATNANDGVNGEDRDRLDSITNFYEIQIECFMEDARELQMLLDEDAQRDTRTQPLENGVGLLVRPNNGTKYSAQASQVTIDDWDWSAAPGRTEASMLKVPLRARYFNTIPSV
jgi:hypothetical protein